MIVTFQEEYLKELYKDGQANDKKHRFQPQIVKKIHTYCRLDDRAERCEWLDQVWRTSL